MAFEEDNSIRTDVELLKKDVHSISRLVDKLDVAIDKLTDVTNCLNRMIVQQELKIEQTEKDERHIYEKVKIIENKVIPKISDRVDKLERWKWLVIGGAIALGFVAAKLPLLQQLDLIIK
tara:strand:+ start:250 stop:609 length:360 start_codon:yes stop_codon:yes gene_type:complete